MAWQRDWDGVQIYDRWTVDGATWTIEDLNPEHDQLAADLMMSQFLQDEPLFSTSDIKKQDDSMASIRKYWEKIIAGRTSLACYRLQGGNKEIAALNLCPVKTTEDPHFDYTKEVGRHWQLVVGTHCHFEGGVDLFKQYSVDKYLSGAGLLVLPQFRGAGLGGRVLAAREPMCRRLGIYFTASVFTGPISQSSAAKCGFNSIVELTCEDLAKAGLNFPGDQKRVLKLMVKKYT